jgi:hypothetical protein
LVFNTVELSDGFVLSGPVSVYVSTRKIIFNKLDVLFEFPDDVSGSGDFTGSFFEDGLELFKLQLNIAL